MLLNSKGEEVKVPHTPAKAPNRDAILAPLYEVLVQPTLKCHGMFSIQARCKLRGV